MPPPRKPTTTQIKRTEQVKVDFRVNRLLEAVAAGVAAHLAREATRNYVLHRFLARFVFLANRRFAIRQSVFVSKSIQKRIL